LAGSETSSLEVLALTLPVLTLTLKALNQLVPSPLLVVSLFNSAHFLVVLSAAHRPLMREDPQKHDQKAQPNRDRKQYHCFGSHLPRATWTRTTSRRLGATPIRRLFSAGRNPSISDGKLCHMLEYGRTYRLTTPVIGEKVDSDNNVLSPDHDRPIPSGTEFTVENWNEWKGTSPALAGQGSNPNHYIVTLKTSVDGCRRFQIMASVLEKSV
jgi:hypothetical protein